ncbi:MAG: ArsR family transcriptional regulator [Archaeoglobaceae archaeon]|nr:ArsR family transcriptional regulator [Archaeoglobaceae archaeon]
MVRRAKLVNDIVELIPIFQLLSSEYHRKVYYALLDGWLTIDELRKNFGNGFEETLRILKHAGMLEVRWRMPSDPAGKPEKEYHVSYTHISANFYVSLEEFNKILEIIFMSDDEMAEHLQKIEKEVRLGRNSVGHIIKTLNYDPLFVRAIVKKSLKFHLKGQLIEFAKDEEV